MPQAWEGEGLRRRPPQLGEDAVLHPMGLGEGDLVAEPEEMPTRRTRDIGDHSAHYLVAP